MLRGRLIVVALAPALILAPIPALPTFLALALALRPCASVPISCFGRFGCVCARTFH